MQLVVDKIAKAFGIHEIFKDVSFMVEQGEHVGLVGVNGSGKTTLLRCLLQPEWVDSGAVKFEPGISVGYVQQGFTDIRGTIWQFMQTACPEIGSLRQKLAQLEADSGKLQGEKLDSCLEEYGRVLKRYEFIDGYNYENRIKRVLIGLGYTEDWWQHDAATLSGGQKTRLMLAAALVRNPDFMILDEPTNHLDIVMTQWLEKYLQEFKGGLLVVSHDRAFLDNVAMRIMEMEGGKLQSFKGNYSRYLEQKAIQSSTLTAAYNAQQDYIARTEAYIRRFKAGIKSKMARGRQSQLDRLERIDAPVQHEEFELRLPPAAECADRVLIMEDLTIGYGEKILAKGINLTLRRGEKAALLGANGTGKTTLLRSLLLRHSDRKIAVLLNDFGDIPVDGETLRRSGVEGGVVVEIGGGSVFCSCLREPFIKALANLAARDEDLIIVEASGMSDPSAVDKMLRLSGLDGLFEHTSTICLFDPVKSLKLARVLEVIPRQLASASVVVLTKADITTKEERDAAPISARRNPTSP